MSRLRRLKQKARREYAFKLKRQKNLFSFVFIVTILISFLMLVVCAIYDRPTLMTTIISGTAWLVFDILYAYAIKRKWYMLFEFCSPGILTGDEFKTEAEIKQDNWQGNCFKFAISVIVFIGHLILFFVLL